MTILSYTNSFASEKSKIDIEKWSEFVYSHPHGNIFQTFEMYKVYKNTKNYEPVLVIAIDDNEDIHGLLLAIIQTEYLGFIDKFTARSIIFGGPLIKYNNPSILDFILKEYDKIIRKKAIYSQFRNMWEWKKSKEIFIKNGFEYEDHLNILINLNKSKEELWKDVHSKGRNKIRRAKIEGTNFSEKNTIKDLHECYKILESVYKRAKLPVPVFSFFENILINTNNHLGLKLFCAENDNKIIGCMIALTYKNTIYDFYAGAYSEYYNKYPNDLIPWEVFLWGKKEGYSIFDFGGAGKPKQPYGVRDYKKKFGGEFVNYGRYEKVHKTVLMGIGKIGLKLWQKLK